MTTVINNPSGGEDSGGMGFVVGILLVIVVVVLFVLYGLPYLDDRNKGSVDIDVKLPITNSEY